MTMTPDRTDAMTREEAIARLRAIKRRLDTTVTVVRVIVNPDGTEGGRIRRTQRQTEAHLSGRTHPTRAKRKGEQP